MNCYYIYIEKHRTNGTPYWELEWYTTVKGFAQSHANWLKKQGHKVSIRGK